MKKHGVCFIVVIVLSMLIAEEAAPYAYSQERLSDKDIQTMFNNLKSDAKKFSSTFNSAVGKSTIRKTTQEKEAKALVQTFDNSPKQRWTNSRRTGIPMSNYPTCLLVVRRSTNC